MAEVKRTDPIQGEIIHVYDGIEEANNKLPNWLSLIFFGSVAFAVFYWFAYHEYQFGPLQSEMYRAELAERAARNPDVSEDVLAALAGDSATVQAGQTVYQTNCVACHDTGAQGKIGPNLTDRYWINGGAAIDIHRTIRDGVAAKGMPGWGSSLGPQAVQQLTAFILSIRDTNVPGKEPQGDLFQPGAAPAAPEGAAPSAPAAAPGAPSPSDPHAQAAATVAPVIATNR